MDIVCHAVESYTARWYTTFDRKKPEERVTYCGSNPVSDLWCEKAMTLLAKSFRTAVHDGADDVEARSDMMMAATFAGMGFGNSGVHIPHANAYPIAGHGEGLPARRLPAGRADGAARDVGVADRAGGVPVQLRQRAGAAPAAAAALLAPDADKLNDPREQLPSVLVDLMRDIEIPNGIGGVGYTEADIPDLVPGHDEAAAAARHLPEDADRGRHRRDLHPVDRERCRTHRRETRDSPSGASLQVPSSAGSTPSISFSRSDASRSPQPAATSRNSRASSGLPSSIRNRPSW